MPWAYYSFSIFCFAEAVVASNEGSVNNLVYSWVNNLAASVHDSLSPSPLAVTSSLTGGRPTLRTTAAEPLFDMWEAAGNTNPSRDTCTKVPVELELAGISAPLPGPRYLTLSKTLQN